MRSLQEWMKYLEQQEQAVKEQPEQEAPSEPKAVVPDREPAVVEPTPRPVQPLQPREPERRAPITPPPPKPPVTTTVQLPVEQPKPKPVVATPVQPAPSTPLAGTAQPQAKAKRKRAPKSVIESINTSETAQKSYKPFKESREELLQRLLDPMISLEEAARLLNVCPTTVRRYTNRGILQHHRTAGNQRRFRLSDVLAFMGPDAPVESPEE